MSCHAMSFFHTRLYTHVCTHDHTHTCTHVCTSLVLRKCQYTFSYLFRHAYLHTRLHACLYTGGGCRQVRLEVRCATVAEGALAGIISCNTHADMHTCLHMHESFRWLGVLPWLKECWRVSCIHVHMSADASTHMSAHPVSLSH